MAINMMADIRKEYPDAQLLLAGNGPKQAELERQILDLGLTENVRLLGYCTCLEKYQRVADVLVSCSRREGLPLNIVEAMLSGTPVVATHNRGHRELIRHGETGYLVDVDDTQAMARAVLKLLKNEEKAARIGENARNFAQKYTYANVKQELEAIYFGPETG